jgi:hypothetical protein
MGGIKNYLKIGDITGYWMLDTGRLYSRTHVVF